MENAEERLGGLGNRLIASLVSDAAFLGGLTFLGYLITYTYMTAEAQVLGIPVMLVSVSLEPCLFVVLSLLLIVYLFAFLANAIGYTIPERFERDSLARAIALLVLMTVVIVAAGTLLRPMFFLFLSAPLIGVGYYAIAPLLEPKTGRTYLRRLREKFEVNRKTALENKKPQWLEARFGLRLGWVLLVPAFGIMIAHQFGRFEGALTTRYFATPSTPPEVLIARYGDMLVFRHMGSPAVTIRVIGKDEIPPLASTTTGSMAVEPWP